MGGWVVDDDCVRLRDDSYVHIVYQLLEPFSEEDDSNQAGVSSSGITIPKYSVDKYECLSTAVIHGNISEIQQLLKPCDISTAGMMYSEDGSSINLMHVAILCQKM